MSLYLVLGPECKSDRFGSYLCRNRANSRRFTFTVCTVCKRLMAETAVKPPFRFVPLAVITCTVFLMQPNSQYSCSHLYIFLFLLSDNRMKFDHSFKMSDTVHVQPPECSTARSMNMFSAHVYRCDNSDDFLFLPLTFSVIIECFSGSSCFWPLNPV